jgi:hypothetical protein
MQVKEQRSWRSDLATEIQGDAPPNALRKQRISAYFSSKVAQFSHSTDDGAKLEIRETLG